MVSMLQHILADARGYSQHLFFGHNDFRQVWTGDRCETHTVVAPLFLQKPITMNWAKTGSGHTRKSLTHSPKQTRRLCFYLISQGDSHPRSALRLLHQPWWGSCREQRHRGERWHDHSHKLNAGHAARLRGGQRDVSAEPSHASV